ncbi:allophanate hydrolase [uncultured Desulfobacter sp.]|uniref:allophanate hydrolase n=1 Tax=uncultured Desulfobacter sp. TaxID=240139 RepID=UPI002AAC44E3|nr:allophanate hydrolase [uncultured Desulfobacter sp.]
MMNLTIEHLHNSYKDRTLTPGDLIGSLMPICRKDQNNVWIRLLTEDEVAPYLKRLEGETPETLPLYGIPFAIKDNIDLAGIPTTAGCPEYSYTPEKSAFVVEQLINAGAIPVGKTNMDQFATGLVGTRSPYGACKNSFHPDYISGGSSSGSAVALAKEMCSFSLGTDTAGSGRVPAAFNNILGVKPSKGLLSTTGVVPACRSLDCVSIFALCAKDAQKIFQTAAVFDPQDPFSRKAPGALKQTFNKYRFTFGVPAAKDLNFFGNTDYEHCFKKSIDLLLGMGGTCIEIDFSFFLDAAQLLYQGPWVAERAAAVGDFLLENPDAGVPVTRQIICDGKPWTAREVFSCIYKLQALKKKTDAILESVDFLVTPTAGTCYTIDAVNADPVRLNSNLGYYTNYMNLLDYCSLAVPTGLTQTVPFGVTLVGQAFEDLQLLQAGAFLHAQAALPMGCGSDAPPLPAQSLPRDTVQLAVCGAHLKGLPLHHQLTDLGALLLQKTHTANVYRMFALKSDPPKPGLIRDEKAGAAIEVEIYSLSASAFGRFVQQIPHPLGIGKLELSDGSWVSGFIAEPVVKESGNEITKFGGWRTYLQCCSFI